MLLRKHDIVGKRVKNVFQTPPVTRDAITTTEMYVELDVGTLFSIDWTIMQGELNSSTNPSELTLIPAHLDGEPSCIGEVVLDIVVVGVYSCLLLSSGRCLGVFYAFGCDSFFVEIFEPKTELSEIRSFREGLPFQDWPPVDWESLESKISRIPSSPESKAANRSRLPNVIPVTASRVVIAGISVLFVIAFCVGVMWIVLWQFVVVE